MSCSENGDYQEVRHQASEGGIIRASAGNQGLGNPLMNEVLPRDPIDEQAKTYSCRRGQGSRMLGPWQKCGKRERVMQWQDGPNGFSYQPSTAQVYELNTMLETRTEKPQNFQSMVHPHAQLFLFSFCLFSFAASRRLLFHARFVSPRCS